MIDLQSTWHLLIISVHQRSLAVHLFCSVNAYGKTNVGRGELVTLYSGINSKQTSLFLPRTYSRPCDRMGAAQHG